MQYPYQSVFRLLVLLVLVMVPVAGIQAQDFRVYLWDEYTITKFEERSFFFRPQETAMGPGGVFSGYEQALPRTFVSETALNPAFLSRLEEGKTVVGVRINTLPEEKIRIGSLGGCPTVNCASISSWSVTVERRPAEPFLAAAAFIRPEGSGLGYGITLQSYSDSQNFYGVLHPIHTDDLSNVFPVITRLSGTESADPATSRFSGTGHFPALHISWQATQSVSGGARVGLGVYNASGELRSRTDGGAGLEATLNHSVNRSQKYRHGEFTAGAEFILTERLIAGITTGILAGKADQWEVHRHNASLNTIDEPDPVFRDQVQAGSGSWDRTGLTWTGRADVRYSRSDHTEFRIWAGWGMTRQQAGSTHDSNEVGASGEQVQLNDGSELFERSFNDRHRGSVGIGSIRDRSILAGSQVAHSISSQIELTLGIQFSRQHRISDSKEMKRYRNRSIRLTEWQDGETGSYFGLTEYSRNKQIELERREWGAAMPATVSIGLFKQLTATATLMPELRGLRTGRKLLEYSQDNVLASQSSLGSNRTGQNVTWNALFTLHYTPVPGTSLSVTGLSNPSDPFTDNIQNKSNIRLAAMLKVAF